MELKHACTFFDSFIYDHLSLFTRQHKTDKTGERQNTTMDFSLFIKTLTSSRKFPKKIQGWKRQFTQHVIV